MVNLNKSWLKSSHFMSNKFPIWLSRMKKLFNMKTRSDYWKRNYKTSTQKRTIYRMKFLIFLPNWWNSKKKTNPKQTQMYLIFILFQIIRFFHEVCSVFLQNFIVISPNHLNHGYYFLSTRDILIIFLRVFCFQ